MPDINQNEQNIFHAEDIFDIKVAWDHALDTFADLFVHRINTGNDDDDEAVDRLIITCKLVGIAMRDTAEFDRRFRKAKMRKLRSDAGIPLFSQAARLGMEFTRQQKKTGKVSSTTVNRYARAANWLFTRPIPMGENAIRDLMAKTNAGRKSVAMMHRAWMEEHPSSKGTKRKNPVISTLSKPELERVRSLLTSEDADIIRKIEDAIASCPDAADQPAEADTERNADPAPVKDAATELDDLLNMQTSAIHQLDVRNASSELAELIRDRIPHETDEILLKKLETLGRMIEAQQKPADDDTDPDDDPPPSGGEPVLTGDDDQLDDVTDASESSEQTEAANGLFSDFKLEIGGIENQPPNVPGVQIMQESPQWIVQIFREEGQIHYEGFDCKQAAWSYAVDNDGILHFRQSPDPVSLIRKWYCRESQLLNWWKDNYIPVHRDGITTNPIYVGYARANPDWMVWSPTGELNINGVKIDHGLYRGFSKKAVALKYAQQIDGWKLYKRTAGHTPGDSKAVKWRRGYKDFQSWLNANYQCVAQ